MWRTITIPYEEYQWLVRTQDNYDRELQRIEDNLRREYQTKLDNFLENKIVLSNDNYIDIKNLPNIKDDTNNSVMFRKIYEETYSYNIKAFKDLTTDIYLYWKPSITDVIKRYIIDTLSKMSYQHAKEIYEANQEKKQWFFTKLFN